LALRYHQVNVRRFAVKADAGKDNTMSALLPSPSALSALKTAAGDGNWSDDPAVLAPRLVDWRGKFHGASSLMLLPRTTQAVAAIVRAAVAHGVALVPQGGNTGLVGGGIPSAAGEAVLLCLARMDRIRSIDAAGLTLTADAGVILENVHAAARAAGCEFPLSLAGSRCCATARCARWSPGSKRLCPMAKFCTS
jgi:hypothetical protein